VEKHTFQKMIDARWNEGKFLCVGLDTDYEKIPKSIKRKCIEMSILEMNYKLIEATAEFVCAFKLNSAFYEAHGRQGGNNALFNTSYYIHKYHPGIPVIIDAKRGDIENTNEQYAHALFERLFADAITIHPYLGREANMPFLERTDKGIFILCRTTGSGSREFQDLEIDGEKLYQIVAHHVSSTWNKHKNCGVVVGADVPMELRRVREIIGSDMPILIPGIGAQGGDLKKVVCSGMNENKSGVIINASRSIMFASSDNDFAEAAYNEAKKLSDLINQYKEEL
jgi:orotidine-5'-phosphate decarboxylase